jgi:hypothetical protein
VFGDGEEYCGFVERFEAVSGVGDDEQVSGAAVPPRVTGCEADPSVQDVDGGFAGVFVFIEGLTGGQRDEGLAELVFVAAVDGGAASTAGGGMCELELLTCQGGQ